MEAHQLQEHAHQFRDAVAAIIEIEAMKARNTQCQLEKEPLTYTEKDFREVAELYGLDYNRNIEASKRFF